MAEDSTSEEFFEAKYQRNADPWNFTTSLYEQGRYAAIVDALRPRRFTRGFEPACSIGILTEKLADFCDDLEATDISPTAVARARERCRKLANVTVTQGGLPGRIPSGTFDLIVFSEVGYYFDSAALVSLVSELVGQLVQGGVLLAAHWLGSSPDHLITGDQVHAIFGTIPNLSLTESQRHEGYRLDLWTRHG